MTALETRTVAGLTSDPDSNVLIDALMAAGLVRHIDVWTDEEAERARLVAFYPETGSYALTRGRRSSRIERTISTFVNGEIAWEWRVRLDHIAQRATLERRVGTFDEPDFALGVSVPPLLDRIMARGRKVPAKFRRDGRQRGQPLPWTELVRRCA